MKGHAPPGPRAVPATALRVVSSPGRPLEPATRSEMEERFGHDFSRIRVHDDGEAADSAREVRARAYSIGSHLVFGPQRYAPGTRAGDALLAHELAHAVQHDRHPGATGSGGVSISTAPDEREAASAAAQVAGGEAAPPLTAAPAAALRRDDEDDPFAGMTAQYEVDTGEREYEMTELRDYLRAIRKSAQIQGREDSDDKAVRIVRLWRRGSPLFSDLSGRDKAIMIWELLDGPTTEPDEEAIVELLERSDNADLEKIFRIQGDEVQKQIAEDVPDGKGSQLADFCRRRWTGGIEAFRKGSGLPRPSGVPVPIGKPLPKPGTVAPVPEPEPVPEKGSEPQDPEVAAMLKDLEAAQPPGVKPSFGDGPQDPAWTPVPVPPETEPPLPPPELGPRRPPMPATGMDGLKAFLDTEIGAQVKNATLRRVGKMARKATPAEWVAIAVNVAATLGISLGVYFGAMSEQQRLEIWRLFTSDQDVNLQRPPDQKAVQFPAVEF